MKNLSDSIESHDQSSVNVLFCASISQFSSLTNRNRINIAVADFHNALNKLSGDDEEVPGGIPL